jgi:hypothetical protein
MHKCILEEDFPGAVAVEVEAGVTEAYCANDWEEMTVKGDFSTPELTQIYAKLKACRPGSLPNGK